MTLPENFFDSNFDVETWVRQEFVSRCQKEIKRLIEIEDYLFLYGDPQGVRPQGVIHLAS